MSTSPILWEVFFWLLFFFKRKVTSKKKRQKNNPKLIGKFINHEAKRFSYFSGRVSVANERGVKPFQLIGIGIGGTKPFAHQPFAVDYIIGTNPVKMLQLPEFCWEMIDLAQHLFKVHDFLCISFSPHTLNIHSQALC